MLKILNRISEVLLSAVLLGLLLCLKNRFLLAVIFIAMPLFLQAVVYMEKPKDFYPKFEVVGCFLEYQDKILLLHRQENTFQGNQWGIPGGKLEKNETPLDAAIREVQEETQFNISNQEIVYLNKVYIKDPKYDFVYHMIKCIPSDHPGSVKINFQEHKGFTWVTPQDALKMDLMLDEDTCIMMIYPYKH